MVIDSRYPVLTPVLELEKKKETKTIEWETTLKFPGTQTMIFAQPKNYDQVLQDDWQPDTPTFEPRWDHVLCSSVCQSYGDIQKANKLIANFSIPLSLSAKT